MASGRLGKATPVANTDTTLYTVPASTVATATVCFCNTTNNPVYVRLAVTTGAAAVLADYLEFEVMVAANGVLERTGIALSAGEVLVVRVSGAGVAVHARGFEEAA